MALLPAYVAAAFAVIVLLTDLFAGPRAVVVATAGGAVLTAVAAVLVGAGPDRRSFCAGDACSYLATDRSALVAVLFALLALAVLALSAPMLHAGAVPAGEYCFLLACSMTGGVVLGAAGDLITLIVALETLTLPLYLLVGLRRVASPRAVFTGVGAPRYPEPPPEDGDVRLHAEQDVAAEQVRMERTGAESAVTFFVVSVVATSVTLLGAALLYAATGALHLTALAGVLDQGGAAGNLAPLIGAGCALLVGGLAFKVAAVPFHAWAPATYDGAPLPVAAYLSTASKLGGVVALLAVVHDVLPAGETSGVLAVLAVLTMTVGNVVALRQTRTVRLLAWSSVAQAGYILAPLGASAFTSSPRDPLVAATLAYAAFFVLLELAAFAAVVALRPVAADGGELADYRGVARRAPWVGGMLAFALIGLAGLPPALAGLFAKVTVVRALVDGGASWLALIVALNAVIGLAYYVRVVALLYGPPTRDGSAGTGWTHVPWPVGTVLVAATVLAVVLGFAPEPLLRLTAL
ncbi:NADH-quinone oxidoreductase subunit N [Catenuloplanes japonicus]|uniref:NADH-quinone oxidoreductase subunit N n=1 Tax=Catenuloplanes japonicus TaxID=33876 RepID=UPI000558A0A9|nr:proton-conducting transporter membrane subunit [Catenuloplanes japonicus]